MSELFEFLSMGGYAFYVWSSYAITAVLLLGIVVWSEKRFKSARIQAFRRAKQTGQKP